VFGVGLGTQLMQVNASTMTYKGTPLSVAGHTHAYLPLSGGTLTGGFNISTDGNGVQLSSGGFVRDTATPQRTLISAAGDRFELFDETSTTLLLAINKSGSVATLFGNNVIHSGNIAAQSVSNAATVGGLAPTTAPGPGRIPISDATGTLNTWVTGTGIGVPAGVIAGAASAASIPAGWVRYSAGDGRLLVGDGTTFSQTFTGSTNYGAAWSHSHAATGLTFIGTAGTTAAMARMDSRRLAAPT
jgi:hypothetical protein